MTPDSSGGNRKRPADVDKQNVERLLKKASDGQAEFVLTEIETAITFCQVALSTSDPKRKTRNIENALKGYQTALRFSQTPDHDLRADHEFQEKLGQLEATLRELGQEI